MSASGRKKDEVWLKFEKVSTENQNLKTDRVKCKQCGQELIALVARMKKHVCQPSSSSVDGKLLYLPINDIFLSCKLAL